MCSCVWKVWLVGHLCNTTMLHWYVEKHFTLNSSCWLNIAPYFGNTLNNCLVLMKVNMNFFCGAHRTKNHTWKTEQKLPKNLFCRLLWNALWSVLTETTFKKRNSPYENSCCGLSRVTGTLLFNFFFSPVCITDAGMERKTYVQIEPQLSSIWLHNTTGERQNMFRYLGELQHHTV